MKNCLIVLICITMFAACQRRNSEENIARNDVFSLEEVNELAEMDKIIEQPFFPTHWTTVNLRLRDEPNTEAIIIQTLQRGTAVKKLEIGKEAIIDNISSSWIFVKTEDGKKGWCFGGYLADKYKVILGIWVEEKNGRGFTFYYFTPDMLVFGIFQSQFIGAGYWSFGENYIYFHGVVADHGERETLSSNIPFELTGLNTLKLFGHIFTRLYEEDLQYFLITKEDLDKLIQGILN